MISDWRKLYGGKGWKDEIVPEAFAHPAKFSRKLIGHIYQHMLQEGWLHEGDTVIDPFGGVALGGLDALLWGMNWTGCELEERFVSLGNQNIELWNTRYGGKMPRWGTARLVQGDSRELCKVLGLQGEAVVSSPPFTPAGSQMTGQHQGVRSDYPSMGKAVEYEFAPGNLGNLPAGDFNAAISSPPYADQFASHDNFIAPHDTTKLMDTDRDAYGSTPGQLGAMPSGSFDAAVSSPPFEDTQGFHDKEFSDQWGPKQSRTTEPAGYGATPGNIGNSTGDTFWTAAATIVAQVYQALAPGAHAVWVVKSYVKNKQRVDFPGQWQTLCEAAGFETLHIHRAWLVEHRGTQIDLDGNGHHKQVERKSFFRRLAEQKGSPRIDYEVVLCTRKP